MNIEKNININRNTNLILQELVTEINKIKPGFILGLYLTGSIPLNDFQPNKSDIDFLLLCNEFPDKDFQLQLEKVHRALKQSIRHANLNGSYLTLDGLNVQNSHKTKTFYIQEGLMQVSDFEMAPITLYELKTIGITLWGTPTPNLPIVVQTNDVNKFLFKNINSYWKTWIDKHSALSNLQLLLILFPRLTEWVILGVARQLYTLQTGKITSKTSAGYYCLDQLPAKYHPIIQEAIKIRNDKSKHMLTFKESYYVRPSFKRSVKTIDCAYFIIDVFNKEYKNKEKNSR